MSGRISPAKRTVLTGVLGSGAVAQAMRPIHRNGAEKCRSAQTNMRYRTRNATRNQRDAGRFQKVTKTACAGPAGSEKLELRNLLMLVVLRPDVADICESTKAKTGKNIDFKTPTVQIAPLIRINDMRGVCRLGMKPGISFAVNKVVQNRPRN